MRRHTSSVRSLNNVGLLPRRETRAMGRGSRCLSLLLAAATAAAVLHEVPAARAALTGWNQTAAGPYDYNTPGNWVGGTINGIWDSSLTLTAGQTITFAAETTLTSGLTFNYAGNYALTFRSDGTANRTLTSAPAAA